MTNFSSTFSPLLVEMGFHTKDKEREWRLTDEHKVKVTIQFSTNNFSSQQPQSAMLDTFLALSQRCEKQMCLIFMTTTKAENWKTAEIVLFSPAVFTLQTSGR